MLYYLVCAMIGLEPLVCRNYPSSSPSLLLSEWPMGDSWALRWLWAMNTTGKTSPQHAHKKSWLRRWQGLGESEARLILLGPKAAGGDTGQINLSAISHHSIWALASPNPWVLPTDSILCSSTQADGLAYRIGCLSFDLSLGGSRAWEAKEGVIWAWCVKYSPKRMAVVNHNICGTRLSAKPTKYLFKE